MLQEFLRCGKKWADKPDSNFREGTRAELGICSAYGGISSKRSPWKWWIFSVDFFGDFWSQNPPPKKSARKSNSQKQKIRQRTTPPKSTNQAQKSAAEPANKSACQTSKYTPGFLRLRRLALGGVFGAWILDTLWLTTGHGRGSHAEMHLQTLSCCLWEGQGLLRILPDNTFSQNTRFEKAAQE